MDSASVRLESHSTALPALSAKRQRAQRCVVRPLQRVWVLVRSGAQAIRFPSQVNTLLAPRARLPAGRHRSKLAL